jgi:hypothetical protein
VDFIWLVHSQLGLAYDPCNRKHSKVRRGDVGRSKVGHKQLQYIEKESGFLSASEVEGPHVTAARIARKRVAMHWRLDTTIRAPGKLPSAF